MTTEEFAVAHGEISQIEDRPGDRVVRALGWVGGTVGQRGVPSSGVASSSSFVTVLDAGMPRAGSVQISRPG